LSTVTQTQNATPTFPLFSIQLFFVQLFFVLLQHGSLHGYSPPRSHNTRQEVTPETQT
jgi:hypothetical protein